MNKGKSKGAGRTGREEKAFTKEMQSKPGILTYQPIIFTKTNKSFAELEEVLIQMRTEPCMLIEESGKPAKLLKGLYGSLNHLELELWRCACLEKWIKVYPRMLTATDLQEYRVVNSDCTERESSCQPAPEYHCIEVPVPLSHTRQLEKSRRRCGITDNGYVPLPQPFQGIVNGSRITLLSTRTTAQSMMSVFKSSISSIREAFRLW